jgi:hypothetical protein
MAEDGAITASKNRSHPVAALGELPPAHGVDPSVGDAPRAPLVLPGISCSTAQLSLTTA